MRGMPVNRSAFALMGASVIIGMASLAGALTWTVPGSLAATLATAAAAVLGGFGVVASVPDASTGWRRGSLAACIGAVVVGAAVGGPAGMLVRLTGFPLPAVLATGAAVAGSAAAVFLGQRRAIHWYYAALLVCASCSGLTVLLPVTTAVDPEIMLLLEYRPVMVASAGLVGGLLFGAWIALTLCAGQSRRLSETGAA